MDRMSPLDASFLHIENAVSHMHIGSVAIFEGPVPAYEEFEAMVAGKLPAVPRYRQKVRFVPLQLGRPLWVDDPHFNLGYHLRHTALASPGGDRELRNLVGRVMSQQLDRHEPLWEMWMVDGLDHGHWALVSKVHHCMVDGVSGTDLLTVVLDAEPEPAPPLFDDWQAEPEPTDARLVVDALGALFASPYEQLRAARSVTRAPRQVLTQVTEVARGLRAWTGVVRRTPPSSINGPIGPHRRWDWARTTIADVKTVRRALGGTVNDVVLTVLTRGFRDLLIARGEGVEDRVVRTLVPVSVRTPGERGTYNNRVSAMIAELPVGVADWPVTVSHDLDAELPIADAVLMLRVQAERMNGGFFPSAREYSVLYGLSEKRQAMLPGNAVVLHPGPMVRGMEIAFSVADSMQSAVLQQVSNGVHVRMAVLFHLLVGAEQEAISV